MCSIYAICKVSNKKKIKFQQIFSRFKEISSFSKYLFHKIVFKCRMKDGQFSDIISFYNDIYIPKLKPLILEIGKSMTAEDIPKSYGFSQ